MTTDEHDTDGLAYDALKSALERQPLFEDKTWRLSPKPWPITPKQLDELQDIGRACHEFYGGIDYLYRRSVEGKNLLRNRELVAPWIHDYLDRGKPFRIIEHGRFKAFKGETPHIIRPDLLLTENGWALTEMDSVPGGIGLTAYLNALYADAGFAVIDGGVGLIEGFYATLRQLVPDIDDPLLAIVVSDEASTYRPEFDYLAAQLQAKGARVHVCHPDELMPTAGDLSIPVKGNPERVDVIYRFWELFDTGNIRTAQSIFTAVESGEVMLTPPMKPYQEEKLNLALLHHPVLESFWKEFLSRSAYRLLKRIVPRSWVMDPVELPPNAVLDAPYVDGKPIREWEALGEASQRERNLIIKASGFHETAWGARSVVYGSDHSREDWLDAIGNATDMAHETLHVLQEYRKPMRLTHPVYDDTGSKVYAMQGRLRLCPFYCVQEDDPKLMGALATFCPADKKIIHGMKDAAMLPCATVD